MILPVYLIARYSKDFNVFLAENVSDPEEYDLGMVKENHDNFDCSVWFLSCLIADQYTIDVCDRQNSPVVRLVLFLL